MIPSRSKLCRLALIFFMAWPLFASTAGVTAAENGFQQGNEAYSRGRYSEAIRDYLQFAEHNGVSASLFYNLGKSYAAAGQTGPAIVNYLRALRLDPGDGAIQAGLEQVRKDHGLYSENRPYYERLAGTFSPDQWACAAGFALFLLSLLFLVSVITNRIPKMVVRGIVFFCLAVMMASVPAAVFQYRTWNSAVVTAHDARLLISPFADAASSAIIQEGRLVRPVKTHGAFFQVVDENGHSGWLAKSALEFISDLPKVDSNFT